jgi:hypothetical protein
MNLKNMPVTYWLIGALFVIFIVQTVGNATMEPVVAAAEIGGELRVVSFGAVDWNFALFPYRVLQGDAVWSTVTSIFLHADPIHFFFNGFALFMFGLFIERKIGGGNLLKLFLISGLIGSIVHLVFTAATGWAFTIPALGASGAIFGILGALMILAPQIKVITLPIPVPLPLWQAILMFTVFALIFLPAIAHDVHIAGLAVGIVMGAYFREKMRRDKDYTWKVVYNQPDDYDWIDEYR